MKEIKPWVRRLKLPTQRLKLITTHSGRKNEELKKYIRESAKSPNAAEELKASIESLELKTAKKYLRK